MGTWTRRTAKHPWLTHKAFDRKLIELIERDVQKLGVTKLLRLVPEAFGAFEDAYEDEVIRTLDEERQRLALEPEDISGLPSVRGAGFVKPLSKEMQRAFRDLPEPEEEDFRQWARENFTPGKPASPLWHPVIREEWARLEAAATSDQESD